MARALEAEAPYFVDYVSQELQDKLQAARRHGRRLHHARPAPAAARAGRACATAWSGVDELLAQAQARSARRRRCIAVDPRTGEILALVGGRSYNQSQYNRAIARAPAAGLGVQAVRLPGGVRACAGGRAHRPHAGDGRRSTSRRRSSFNDQTWTPEQLRRRVRRPDHAAPRAGAVAQHRRRSRSPRRPATTRSPRCGARSAPARRRGRIRRSRSACSKRRRSRSPRPTRSSRTAARSGRCARSRGSSAAARTCRCRPPAPKTVARPDTTFLVTNMMRSVINEGTGAGARAAGFTLDAAGKSGTTNDLRDAWFVGFTPELLTVVWVGLDDNQPLGLSGTQAALPIWTAFMTRALAGRAKPAVRGARRHHLRRHRPRHRQARRARLPARLQRSLPRRHRAEPRSASSTASEQPRGSGGRSTEHRAYEERRPLLRCFRLSPDCSVRSVPRRLSWLYAAVDSMLGLRTRRVLAAALALCCSAAACKKNPAAQTAAAQTPAGRRPAAGAATRAAQAVPAELPEVLARVNGEDVTKADFDRLVKNIELGQRPDPGRAARRGAARGARPAGHLHRAEAGSEGAQA